MQRKPFGCDQLPILAPTILTNPKLATKLASRRYVGTPYISGGCIQIVGKNQQTVTGLGVMIEVDELLRTLGMVTLDTWPLADWYKFQISSS